MVVWSAASRQELNALFQSKIRDQLHWEVDRPYILREICVDRSPSYGTWHNRQTINDFINSPYCRLVCWPAGWRLWELIKQLKTASRLVAGLKELWEGCGTSNCAESEGGSVSGLVSSLADYFNMMERQVTMKVIQDAVTPLQLLRRWATPLTQLIVKEWKTAMDFFRFSFSLFIERAVNM